MHKKIVTFLRSFKTVDLDNPNLNNVDFFNSVGIAKLNKLKINHLALKKYFDELSLNFSYKQVNEKLPEYKDKWKEISLIRNWKITEQGELMKECLLDLKKQFNTRIRYMSFYSAKPGLVLHLHRDLSGNLIQGFIRLHIPIYTHPDCYYICGSTFSKRKINAKTGNVYALDTGYLHGVVNNSSVNRIHLLVELEVNRWMKLYLPKKSSKFFLHLAAFVCFWAPLSFLKDPSLLKILIKSKVSEIKRLFLLKFSNK